MLVEMLIEITNELSEVIAHCSIFSLFIASLELAGFSFLIFHISECKFILPVPFVQVHRGNWGMVKFCFANEIEKNWIAVDHISFKLLLAKRLCS